MEKTRLAQEYSDPLFTRKVGGHNYSPVEEQAPIVRTSDESVKDAELELGLSDENSNSTNEGGSFLGKILGLYLRGGR
jgi:hypothetical protein